MREILFRGKRMDNGKWVEGNLFIPDLPNAPTEICIGTNVIRITYDIDPETVGQYTGLTDKNGKKVFEGDIVIISNRKNYPMLVKFCESTWNCIIPYDYAYLHYRHRLENNNTKYEIIGNIHDNPELLKGERQ